MSKAEKHCNLCVHWSRHVCVDKNGEPVKREAALAPDPVWYYEECKKNWGLPKSAFLDAVKCNFYRTK